LPRGTRTLVPRIEEQLPNGKQLVGSSRHEGCNPKHAAHAPSAHIDFQTITNYPNTQNPIIFHNLQFLNPNPFRILPAIPLQETDFPRQSPPEVRLPVISTPQFPRKKQIFAEFQFAAD
jgi:hypothetical protein